MSQKNYLEKTHEFVTEWNATEKERGLLMVSIDKENKIDLSYANVDPELIMKLLIETLYQFSNAVQVDVMPTDPTKYDA